MEIYTSTTWQQSNDAACVLGGHRAPVALGAVVASAGDVRLRAGDRGIAAIAAAAEPMGAKARAFDAPEAFDATYAFGGFDAFAAPATRTHAWRPPV
ncbi:hypothetical protein [Nocardioides zeae]|uniref:Uncharacterized protein n=1 Tax=Nocardioides zeae TaxID=1457234 RepID=A0A6P0HN79_9ACTN|nr:hypothetical protein [Nocardioides zeae]NEN79694.1 hypothetical protein [Nocardioides zeae]